MTIVIPIFPVLGAGTVQTGLLFSAKACVQVISAPVVATFVDKQGLRPMIAGLCIEVRTRPQRTQCMAFSLPLTLRV